MEPESAKEVQRRPYDIIIWGATSYTAKRALIHLCTAHSAEEVTVAIAGRNYGKLEYTKKLLNLPTSVAVITASLSDEASLKQMASQAAVLLSCVGPYVRYGEPIVKACIETSTHYVDITGEYGWIREMRMKYDHEAKQKGVAIVHCAGFDYAINDISLAYFMQVVPEELPGWEVKYPFIQSFKSSTKSGSHGTLATIIDILKSKPPSQIIEDGSNPFCACEEQPTMEVKKANTDIRMPCFDPLVDRYLAPALMVGGMMRFMHWSNEVQGHKYGKDFAMKIGEEHKSWSKAMLGTVRLLLTYLVIFLCSRFAVLQKYLMPEVGEGPVASKSDFVKMSTAAYVVKGEESKKYRLDFLYTNGESYMLTAVAAIEIALEMKRRVEMHGVLSPSGAINAKNIVDRLKRVGMSFEWNKETVPLQDG